MEPTILYIIIGVAALIAGVVTGKLAFAKNTRKQVEEAETQAQTILKEAELRAETIKKEKELEAKEKFVQLKSDHDRDVMERNRKLGESENRARQKEQSINQKEGNLEKQIKENEAIKENLNRQIEVVNLKRTELEKHQEEHIRRLEKIAGLSAAGNY
jgi:ribonucrease Y